MADTPCCPEEAAILAANRRLSSAGRPRSGFEKVMALQRNRLMHALNGNGLEIGAGKDCEDGEE
eukprot:12149720-Alexandrium_andersonii.AAC.1